ncbi:MAG TPA: class II aldolase/adducin family protein [Actinomycetes bacterium]
MRLQDAREAVAAGGRRLAASGLVESTSGNLSVRDAGGLVAISPSALAYDRVGAADVVVVGPDGRVADGHRTPSSELGMHLAVYGRRPEVGAVVHTHSPWATSLAVLGREIPAVHYVIASIGRRVRVAPYATFGSAALAAQAAATLGGDNAVLLANHGVLAVGTDLDAAFDNAVRVEFLAEVYWKACQLGEPVVLPDEEIERVAALMAAMPRDRPEGG